jgi:CHASE2 domain-containing sensor protein/predicted Ser/Thr protein kinase
MSYCINPKCLHRKNPDDLELCQSCGANLIINERYRLIRPLRELDPHQHTEIFEVDNLGTPKVLKVLTSNRRRLVKLFEQEAKILEKLKDLEVPQVDTYFTLHLNNGSNKLHCLVMEKIPGQSLMEWMQNNGFLHETLAINWMQQLVKILARVHQQQLLHRDIKPSNIILRPDGRLVLIDFGAARSLTATYIEKLDKGDATRIYTPGYTAPEQLNGQAVSQSDFFALGRTFVHLLTGVHPDDLPTDPQTKQLVWHDIAFQISAPLANLIDKTIVTEPQERLQRSQLILEQLQAIESHQPPQKIALPRKKNSKSNPITSIGRRFSKILLLSVAIAALVIGIRYFGGLQPSELQAFDRLMGMRPAENQDQRLLIVTIDEADIQYQDRQKMPIRWSLSDRALELLLNKLEQYQPRAIGLDIYRDFPVDSNYPNLAERLRSDSRFFAPCKIPAPEDGAPDGLSPPPEVPPSRLGFSDFVADEGEIVRRQLLHLTPPLTSPCAAEYSLSLQLATHYLAVQGIEAKLTAQNDLQIGNVVFKPLNPHSSGYQRVDASGYQVMLNYRFPPFSRGESQLNFAQQVSLREILEDKIDPKLIKSVRDRIVLIGVTAPSTTDYWSTPYTGEASARQKIAGVYVQAQMISQILSAVLDGRSLIWWWSFWADALWIWLWALVGGILAWRIRQSLYLGLAVAGAVLLLFSICVGFFFKAGWIPLIPSAFALILTSITVVALLRSPNNIIRNS